MNKPIIEWFEVLKLGYLAGSIHGFEIGSWKIEVHNWKLIL